MCWLGCNHAAPSLRNPDQESRRKGWRNAAPRLRGQLDQRGTLDVLRHGIENVSWKGMLKLAEFKPALAININILTRYSANRLRVVRQLRYLLHNESSLDRKELEQMNPLGILMDQEKRPSKCATHYCKIPDFFVYSYKLILIWLRNHVLADVVKAT